MSERLLFVLQRVSALVLAPLVLAHLGIILFAVRDGLTAAEILSRTQGHIGWALFYGGFVVAVAVHAPIGLRAILKEWSILPPRWISILMLGFSALLLVIGLRAVAAVIGGPG